MNTQRIALFPLGIVLFPGRALPLHVFEPRYKLMIHACIDKQECFGVLFAPGEGMAAVGCTARVARLMKQYDDGRIDILAQGEAPYRIRELHEDKSYLEATIEILEDDLLPGPVSVSQELQRLFVECHQLANGGPPPAEEDPLGTSLAYQVASELPLDLRALQELLEIRTEAHRQTRLVERLLRLLPQLKKVGQMRSRATGNGHGPN